MLVFSREVNGKVMIGDDIEITVVGIKGDKVRLGFVAPEHVVIHRKEIYEQLKREGRLARSLAGHGRT